MSQAEDLLNSLTEDEIAAYTVDHENEPHIVIDDNRRVTVPDVLKRVAVQYDHNVETVIFDCPRYWDGHDLSLMKIYINYQAPNGMGAYLAQNVTVDESDNNLIHFEWTISKNITMIKGKIAFLVCAKKTDAEGNEANHWNSELNEEMYISEGLECVEVFPEKYPDLFTQLLEYMDETKETTGEYANLARSYAVGTDSEVRVGDERDNAKFYSRVAQTAGENAEEAAEEAKALVNEANYILESGALVGPQGIQGPPGEKGEKGDPGEKGEKGDPGESGVIVPINSFFTMTVDTDGNLWAHTSEGEGAPEFEYDEETGDLYFVTED